MKSKSKVIVFFIVAMMAFGLLSACSSDEVAPPEPEKIVYESISPYEVFSAYKENKLRAEEVYVGRYGCFEGVVGDIDDGSITVYIDTELSHIFCKFSNELKESVLALNADDYVSVSGEIYSVNKREVAIKLHSVEVLSIEPEEDAVTVDPGDVVLSNGIVLDEVILDAAWEQFLEQYQ